MSERQSRAQRTNTPLGRALRYVGLVLGGFLGWGLGTLLESVTADSDQQLYQWVFAATLGALFFMATPYLTIGFFRWLFQEIRRLSASDLVVVAVALVIGGLISFLLAWPISLLPDPFGQILPAASAVVICVLAILALVANKREFLAFIQRSRSQAGEPSARVDSAAPDGILLDTSVIIDGRVADLTMNGFLTGDIIVPQFVLRELQLIADAGGPSRRERGRRGLTVLDRLRRESDERLVITDLDVPEEQGVDGKLIRLAKAHGYRVLTGDQNLERVGSLQGVRVLNIHQLAHVLRPPLVAGEEIPLKITQPGREYGQGVGFLDDGTMIVVESGKDLVGQDVTVVVTRTLQTGAGRMAFAQLAQDRELP